MHGGCSSVNSELDYFNTAIIFVRVFIPRMKETVCGFLACNLS